MIIHSKIKDYEVVMGNNTDFLNDLCGLKDSQFVIDEKVYRLYSDKFSSIPEDRLILIEAIEHNKIIDTALEICEKMTEIPAKRNATLISVGGGIIQDLTGFVANILYRGIKWIFVPTTLLACSDSCIGGKTSLNYKKYKNLLGTFYPPDTIYVCPIFFDTLSEKDFKSGLGEVIKFNIMAGDTGLTNIENNIDKLLIRDHKIVSEFVLSSLEYKSKFIEIDEFDRGERIKLNFAHTFGHAIEVVTNYCIPHGTAVAIGMIMADSISVKRGLLTDEVANRSKQVLLKVIDIDVDLLNVDINDVIKAIRKDKKQTNDSLAAVLLANNKGLSELVIVYDMTIEEVKYSFESFFDDYTNK